MIKDNFPEEEELVLCTVDRILGTTVFVKIDDYGKEGVIATSEVAPGRIRNIRDYVVPQKKIVCKVLRVNKERGSIDLSLRRVSLKEKNKIIESYEKEKNASAILKVICKDRAGSIVDKIKEKNQNVFNFLKDSDEKALFEVGLGKEEIEQLKKILAEKQLKKAEIKLKISLSSDASDGIIRIKNILKKGLDKNIKITYISASKYLLTLTTEDFKEGNRQIILIKEKMFNEAKNLGSKIEFSE